MALITIDDFRVEDRGIDFPTLPANEAITQGQVIRINTSGYWVVANATDAANAGAGVNYVATRTVNAGFPLTGVRTGAVLWLGTGLDGLAIGAAVYASDTAGRLDTAAGTVSIVLGRVICVHENASGLKKLLRLMIPS